jgi:beta-glucosidase
LPNPPRWRNLKNPGGREGKEVIELYLSKRFASITPLLSRLKRFAKIDLRPCQEHRVSFELTSPDLTVIGLENRPVIEPGMIDVHISGMTQSFEWK